MCIKLKFDDSNELLYLINKIHVYILFSCSLTLNKNEDVKRSPFFRVPFKQSTPSSPSKLAMARRQSSYTRVSTNSALLAVVSPSSASKRFGSSSPYILITYLDVVTFIVPYFSTILFTNYSCIILLYP